MVCGRSRMLLVGYPSRSIPTGGWWVGQDNAILTDLTSSQANCLHPVRAMSPTGRNGLDAHRPDDFSGSTGENAPAKRPATCPGVNCRGSVHAMLGAGED
jgi:hypothetical protein